MTKTLKLACPNCGCADQLSFVQYVLREVGIENFIPSFTGSPPIANLKADKYDEFNFEEVIEAEQGAIRCRQCLWQGDRSQLLLPNEVEAERPVPYDMETYSAFFSVAIMDKLPGRFRASVPRADLVNMIVSNSRRFFRTLTSSQVTKLAIHQHRDECDARLWALIDVAAEFFLVDPAKFDYEIFYGEMFKAVERIGATPLNRL